MPAERHGGGTVREDGGREWRTVRRGDLVVGGGSIEPEFKAEEEELELVAVAVEETTTALLVDGVDDTIIVWSGC